MGSVTEEEYLYSSEMDFSVPSAAAAVFKAAAEGMLGSRSVKLRSRKDGATVESKVEWSEVTEDVKVWVGEGEAPDEREIRVGWEFSDSDQEDLDEAFASLAGLAEALNVPFEAALRGKDGSTKVRGGGFRAEGEYFVYARDREEPGLDGDWLTQMLSEMSPKAFAQAVAAELASQAPEAEYSQGKDFAAWSLARERSAPKPEGGAVEKSAEEKALDEKISGLMKFLFQRRDRFWFGSVSDRKAKKTAEAETQARKLGGFASGDEMWPGLTVAEAVGRIGAKGLAASRESWSLLLDAQGMETALASEGFSPFRIGADDWLAAGLETARSRPEARETLAKVWERFEKRSSSMAAWSESGEKGAMRQRLLLDFDLECRGVKPAQATARSL